MSNQTYINSTKRTTNEIYNPNNNLLQLVKDRRNDNFYSNQQQPTVYYSHANATPNTAIKQAQYKNLRFQENFNQPILEHSRDNKKSQTETNNVVRKSLFPIEINSINEDPNPEIINRKINQPLEYKKEFIVRYLKPPTPPPPGEIFIVQEPDKQAPPQPPLVIRQQPTRPKTPEAVVLREAPPKPPQYKEGKLITVTSKKPPLEPRKIIVENFPPVIQKPQTIIIERWLPYKPVKRKIIYQKIRLADKPKEEPKVNKQYEQPFSANQSANSFVPKKNANNLNSTNNYVFDSNKILSNNQNNYVAASNLTNVSDPTKFDKIDQKTQYVSHHGTALSNSSYLPEYLSDYNKSTPNYTHNYQPYYANNYASNYKY